LLLLLFTLAASPAYAIVTFDFVEIGDIGNPADTRVMIPDGTTGYGSVNFRYKMAKHEVTNAQYVEFLNSKANVGDPYALYAANMSADSRGGIVRTGSGILADPWIYSVKTNGGRTWDNKPVNYICWHDAVRFANWMTNGQGSGDTEGGPIAAYQIAGGGPNSGSVTVPTMAQKALWSTSGDTERYVVPGEDEWYKAAYYDPNTTTYSQYPVDSPPVSEAPAGGTDSANYKEGGNYANGDAWLPLTDVGAYTTATSHYGTFDQGGNAVEWNDGDFGGGKRGLRGGSWIDPVLGMDAGYRSGAASGSGIECGQIGFRMELIPEPSSIVLMVFGAAALAWFALRRRRVVTAATA